MFGREQACAQTRLPVRLLARTVGEFRFPLRLRALYLARALPADHRPRRIWDAGCGQGQTSFYLAERYPVAELIGTDLNPSAVAHCERIAKRLGVGNVSFRVKDLAGDFSSDDSGCDLITCFEVLEHIEGYEQAIKNLARHLSPGGWLLVHTPAAGRFQKRDFGLRKLCTGDPPASREAGQFHVRPGFEPESLRHAVAEAGLHLRWMHYTFGPLSMWAHTFYECTRSRTRLLQVATLPLLMTVGWLDSKRHHREGGGLFFCAERLS